MDFLNYIFRSSEKESKSSLIKQFLKDPDSHKILVETDCDEIVIRIRRKNGGIRT